MSSVDQSSVPPGGEMDNQTESDDVSCVSSVDQSAVPPGKEVDDQTDNDDVGYSNSTRSVGCWFHKS